MADGSPPRRWRDRALVQLTLARYREFYREPEAVFWTFIFPLIMAGALGIAFRSRPPEVVKIGVIARPEAAATVEGLRQSPLIDLRTFADDSTAARELRTGKVALVVVPQASGTVEYRFNDTRAEGASARRLADDALQRAAGRADPVVTTDALVREPGSRYIDFLIPGLLGMNLMASSMWGIGFTVVDQRRKKLLKRFVATPMRRLHYLGAFVLSRLSLLAVEVGFLVGMGMLVFGVPFRGSVVTLAAVALLGSMAFSGMGLLVAARPKTIEAASGLMNLTMLPMWVLSGVFFSSANFPDAMQPFIKLLPLTAANNALRATMLEGVSLASLGGELTVLAAWLVVTLALALKIFRWQ